jgi:hypothetical protein
MHSDIETNTFSSVINTGPNFIVTNLTGTQGDVSITLLGSSPRMGAVFNVKAGSPSSLSPAVNEEFAENALRTAQFRFGSAPTDDPRGAGGTTANRGVYVDTRNFAALNETTFNPNGTSADTSSVNGRVLNGPGVTGGLADSARSLMVVSDAVNANTQTFLSSISSATVTPCQCDYTRWGFWSSYVTRTDTDDPVGFSDRGNLNLWVGGVPAKAADIPTTGTATYNGHVIANVNNNGSQYIAAGTFTDAVNFGTRTGAVAIGNLDNSNYTGTVNLAPASVQFGGNLVGSIGSRTAVINGSFFQGGPANSTPLYGEMAGSINLTGTNYLGSGIFAGRKP